MGADGEVVISTRVATTQAEKDLVKFEKELEKFNEKGEKLLKQKAELDVKKTNVDEANKELEKYNALLERAKEKLQRINESHAFIASEEDNATLNTYEGLVTLLQEDVEKYKMQLASANEEYQKAIPELEEIDKKIKDNARSQDIVKRKIEETNAQINRNNLAQIKDQLNNIGNSTTGVIKKVTKWGLALVGIRSAYAMLSTSASMLSSQNEQIGTDIEYIRWAIATTLQPVVEFIIKLAYTLLGIINSISSALFGVNIFANASADAFAKTKNNIKGANSEAKKLQKTLAGFDEMNILQEDGSVASGGGGGGITLPSMDLSKTLEGFNLGEIFSGIIETVVGLWQGFTNFIENDVIRFFGSIGGPFDLFFTGVGVYLQGLYYQWKGVFERIYGVFQVFVGVLNGDFELIKEGVTNIFNGMFDTARGIVEKIFGLFTMNVGLLKGIFETVANIIGNVLNKIKELIWGEDEETAALNRQKVAADNLKRARDRLKEIEDEYAQAVIYADEKQRILEQTEKDAKQTGEQLYKQVMDNNLAYGDLDEKQKALFKAYADNKVAQERIVRLTEEENKTRRIAAQNLATEQGEVWNLTHAYTEDFKALTDGLETGETKWDEYKAAIDVIMSKLMADEKRAFVQELPDNVREGMRKMYEETNDPLTKFFGQVREFDIKVGDAFDRLKTAFKNTGDEIDKTKKKVLSLKDSFSSLSGSAFVNIKFSTGGVGYAKGGIVTKLATGGIVNRPGRGVPVANASMGEAGREGILPLTDAQAMETLGQAIGRYVNINANIPVYMGNRQIAREIRKIEAEDDFAFNS